MAKEYGVKVEPSTRQGKKIKVTAGSQVFHLGDITRKDYSTLLCEKDPSAEARQKNFHKRFFKAMSIPGSGAYWVAKLLWLL